MVLNQDDLSLDPFDQFADWFVDADENPAILDANKMCVSTVDEDGYPDNRYVLMKYYDDQVIRFYTNYNSTKGKQLEKIPKIAVNFLWRYADYFRQIRVKGDVRRCEPSVADAYFATRSRGSKIGAWASEQSSTAENRNQIDTKYEYYSNKFADQEIPRPPYWSGYDIDPISFEFWQTGDNRLHDRFLYSKTDRKTWKIARLYP